MPAKNRKKQFLVINLANNGKTARSKQVHQP